MAITKQENRYGSLFEKTFKRIEVTSIVSYQFGFLYSCQSAIAWLGEGLP